MATDPLAPTRPAAAALVRTTPSARRLARGLPLPVHPPGVLPGPVASSFRRWMRMGKKGN